MTTTMPEGGRRGGKDSDRLSTAELSRLTEAILARMHYMLRKCRDADVTFVPDDPLADDPEAKTSHETGMGWTLGHIIVHLTASAEESAALAAELARGVPYHGRSRREVPWQEMTSVAQCRARLRECRQLCRASLGMWPADPDLSNAYVPWEGASPMGAVTRYLLGLHHAAGHEGQLHDVIAQARAARRKRLRWGRWRQRRAALGAAVDRA